jgi:dihydropteroate synthase
MGIVNVTPDSFSGDGIRPHDDFVARATAQAMQMIEDGADILDIGGESSRPGATPVPAEEEICRTAPVIVAIREQNARIPLSIDTIKTAVAKAALQAGATIVNDVSALAGEGMGEAVLRHGAEIVLMHNRATTASIDAKTGGHYDAVDYANIVPDVAMHLASRAQAAETLGIARDKIILDPGLGFGKTPQQDLALIAHLDKLAKLGYRILMGPSRKSFIGRLLDLPVSERLEGTAACVTACVLNGADIIRVHDVKFMASTIKMAAMLRDA